MTDWSVVGEIIGETNLDEVGESIERSLEGAAQGATKAASGAEDMEKSMDSATEAVASLSGTSENLDDDLQDVEDELEDIVSDSGAAAASVRILSASMSDVEDMDIEVDTNIDELNAAWREMRNDITDLDDLEARPDIIPQRAAGQPLTEFLGEPEGLDEPVEEFEELRRARDRLGERDVDPPDVFSARQRSISGNILDSDVFRENIVSGLGFREGLDPDTGQRQAPAIIGRALSDISGDTNVEDLARRLSNMDAVTSDFTETLDVLNQQLEETGDAIETNITGLTPEQENRLEQERKLRGGVGAASALAQAAQEAAEEGQVTTGEGLDDETLRRIPTDIPSPMDDRRFQQAVSEEARRTTAIPTDVLDAFDRSQLAERGELETAQIAGIDRERIRVSNEAIESLGLLDESTRSAAESLEGGAEAGDFAQDELADLSETAGEARRNINRHADTVDDAQTRIGQATNTFASDEGRRALERIRAGGTDGDIGPQAGRFRGMDIPGLERRTLRERLDFDELAESAARTSTSLGFMMASMSVMTGQAKTAEKAVDDLDDEVEDLGRSLAVVGSGFQNLSANLGPFNISLSNLLITIPILLATIGPFIAVLAGLASAALAVGAAFASIIAVGALGFTEKLQENFAGIQSTTEAVEAIFQGLKESILEAIEPLQDVEIAGLGPTGLFVTVLQDIVTLINHFAIAMAELLEMEVVEDFLLRMRAAVLGFSEETADGMTVIDGLKNLMKDVLPILGDFLVWLIDVTPEFLTFVGKITEEAAPAIGTLLESFLGLSVALTEVGTGFFGVLLPALAFVMDVATVAIRVLQFITEELGLLSEALFLVSGGAVLAAISLAKVVTVLESSLLLAQNVSRGMDLLTESLEQINPALLTFGRRLLFTVGGLALIAAGLYLILDAFGVAEPIINGLSKLLGFFVGGIISGVDALNNFGVAGEIVIRTLKVLTGLLLIYIGYQALFAKATFISTGATQGLAGSLTSLRAALLAVQTVGIVLFLVAMAEGLQFIANNFGVAQAAVVGFIAVLATLVTAAWVTAGAVMSALIATGIGALFVAIGIAILGVIKHFDTLKSVASDAMSGLVEFFDIILWKVDDFVAGLLKAVGLLNDVKALAPVPGALGEQQEGGGLGSIFAKTASGAAVGAGAGTFVGGPAGTIGGGIVGGLAGLADATVLQKGGYVKEGGLALLHSDEMVVPADKLKNMGASANVGVDTRQPRSRDGQGGQMQQNGQVIVNIDNSGDETLDARRAHEVSNVIRKAVDDRRRRENGR